MGVLSSKKESSSFPILAQDAREKSELGVWNVSLYEDTYVCDENNTR